jgi:hypothetical protein
MPAQRSVPDDQQLSLGARRHLVQQRRDMAALDDDVGPDARTLLKRGHLFGGEADDGLLPHRIDVGYSPGNWPTIRNRPHSAAADA